MKSEKVLQSSFLDILFENRNKQYGAYPLRKYYATRLKKAIGVTVLLALLFFILLTSFKSIAPTISHTIKTPRELPPPPVPVKPKEKIKEKIPEPKGNLIKQIPALTKPKLVDEKEVPNPPDLNAKGSIFGNSKDSGSLVPGFVGDPKAKDSLVQKKDPPKILPEIIPEDPAQVYHSPDTEASYPGGKDALAAYLQDKLGDQALEEGAVKKITVHFIIEADGTITNINTQNNQDADFIRKTEKAIGKMKKWNPGKVKGRAVRTYFTMPVTIMPGED